MLDHCRYTIFHFTSFTNLTVAKAATDSNPDEVFDFTSFTVYRKLKNDEARTDQVNDEHCSGSC